MIATLPAPAPSPARLPPFLFLLIVLRLISVFNLTLYVLYCEMTIFSLSLLISLSIPRVLIVPQLERVIHNYIKTKVQTGPYGLRFFVIESKKIKNTKKNHF